MRGRREGTWHVISLRRVLISRLFALDKVTSGLDDHKPAFTLQVDLGYPMFG